ncbi:MAG: flavodoxin reductase, partial [Propionibacterium sp.]|nr:flavodoxin reductase [Propionibacterium sp.]
MTRLRGLLGSLSMYRLVLLALATLTVTAFAVSFTGQLVTGPWELLATLATLVVACLTSDAIAQRLLGLPGRLESSLITALILVFVVRPTLTPAGLLGIALAGAVAAASKYLLVWRGRHVFNPAAVGATILLLSGLGNSAWWVGTPLLIVPVLVLGWVVLQRTDKTGLVAVFWLVAMGVSFVRTLVQAQLAGLTLNAG